MNRTTPLPLTGGVPQPLTELSDCIISAECRLRPTCYSVTSDRIGGSDRSQETIKAKSGSFHKLAGDPTKGVKGGQMVHALRSECRDFWTILIIATGSSACNLAAVCAGQLDIYW
jgi:myo-inositol-1(or 4)-monophosphatase